MISEPLEYEGGKLYGDPLEYFIKQRKETARLKEEQKGAREKDLKNNVESKSDNLSKGTTQPSNKEKKQTKKGEKHESSQSDFLNPIGDADGPVE